MPWLFTTRRSTNEPTVPSEQEVVRAGDDFTRKERLVEQFTFLPDELKRAARDTALNRFLDILFSHLRK